jgi:hypothetical protein
MFFRIRMCLCLKKGLAMRLQSLKTAIKGMMAQADQSRSPAERQSLYLHTCQVLTLLLDAPDEAEPGWSRAALTILRPMTTRQSGPMPALTPSRSPRSPGSTRPLVEAVGAAPSLADLQESLLTVLELPDITSLASLEGILAPIEAAISVGAPRYNRGDIAGCARLYYATALTLTLAQANRGFPGQARALDTLKKGLTEAQTALDVDARAWALRHAFDRVLR